MNPRAFELVLELQLVVIAVAHAPEDRRMFTRISRLRIPIRNRNEPDTPGPISRVASCSVEPSSSTEPVSPRTPIEKRKASRKTIVEWPSEKKNPTLSGRWPSAISFRVVLSIAPMWSASKAWRRPSVYAVIPRPSPNAPSLPRLKSCGMTRTNNRKNPVT